MSPLVVAVYAIVLVGAVVLVVGVYDVWQDPPLRRR
jgi:hypothetical protein